MTAPAPLPLPNERTLEPELLALIEALARAHAAEDYAAALADLADAA